MKPSHVLIATCAFAVASCAGIPQASSAGGTSAAAGAQYCKRDRLTTDGDKLVCTWSPTFAEACENTNLAEVVKSTVASGPTNAGRCGNGQWLVSVTTR
jgi:hypothetical protein